MMFVRCLLAAAPGLLCTIVEDVVVFLLLCTIVEDVVVFVLKDTTATAQYLTDV